MIPAGVACVASCETVLANEQVVQGQCERCDAVVVKKDFFL